jgi:hypothetical protein
MGYSHALEAAGAKVLGYRCAGSYQGMWGAVIIYNGKLGLVTGAYGSCSVCDAFEGEFGIIMRKMINIMLTIMIIQRIMKFPKNLMIINKNNIKKNYQILANIIYTKFGISLI